MRTMPPSVRQLRLYRFKLPLTAQNIRFESVSRQRRSGAMGEKKKTLLPAICRAVGSFWVHPEDVPRDMMIAHHIIAVKDFGKKL